MRGTLLLTRFKCLPMRQFLPQSGDRLDLDHIWGGAPGARGGLALDPPIKLYVDENFP